MSRLAAALWCLAVKAALAGCLSFVEPEANSDCTPASSELVWGNPVRLLQRVRLPHFPYDRQLYDPALSQGLALKGDLQFDLRATGPQLVEVFLATEEAGRPFVLEAGGRALGSQVLVRPAGVRLTGSLHAVCLLGILSGPFTVHSTSRFVVSAVRWTPQAVFEGQLVPAWLDRVRQLAADPFFEESRAGRRESMEQLYERLALSSRAEVRQEAVVGQARAAYWLAALDHDPYDIERAASLFREAFKQAPRNEILRQTVSASCAERNVQNAKMPYGAFCVDVEPVPWKVSLPPDPPEAPEWAVSERRLAARLEAITRWWVERRQRPGGEIGGGWADDAELVRQWGLQALGFGTPVAASGFRRFADGVHASGVAAEHLGNLDELDQLLTGTALPASGARSGEPGGEASSTQLPFEVLWNMDSLARDSDTKLTRDFDMFTSEVIYTSRVYYWVTADYWRNLVGGDRPATFTVTWIPSSSQFARAVVASTSASLKLRLFSFEPRPVSASMRMWGLEPGTYRWETADTIGTGISSGNLVITRRGQTFSVALAPAKEIELTLARPKP